MSQSSPHDDKVVKRAPVVRVRRGTSLRLPRQKSISSDPRDSGSSSPRPDASPRARRSESSSGALLRPASYHIGATSGGSSSAAGSTGGGGGGGGGSGGRKSPSPAAGAFLRIRSFSRSLKLRHQRSSESHDSTVSTASSCGVYEATADNGRKTPKGKGDGAEEARETDVDIDPVYHLLKCAANKGQYCATCGGPKNTEGGVPIAPPNSGCSSPASVSSTGGTVTRDSANNSPTSMLSGASGTGSCVSGGGPSSSASWTRRKAMMNAFRMKSISTDESATTQPPTAARASSASRMQSSQISGVFPNKGAVQTDILPSNSRRKLDSRMKSVSIDNPDTVARTEAPGNLDQDTKKKSSSFTNTNCIEDPVPMSPRRKKHLYGRKKSFSVEQEAGTGLRRVEFDEESIVRKSERRGTMGGGQCSPRSSPKRMQPSIPGTQPSMVSTYAGSREELKTTDYTQRRLQWRMKSFSLDTSDPVATFRRDYDGGGATVSGERSSGFRKTPSPNPLAYSGHPSNPPPSGSSGELSRKRSDRSDRSSGSFEGHGMGASSNWPASEGDTSPRGATSSSWRHGDTRLSGNLYVVMYDFYGRRRDELDLKSGWKVSVMDTSDHDWWTGMCNGKVGFFPSAYVQRLRPGDQVWRVSHPLQLNDQRNNTVKLFRGQIVIQAGMEDHGMIPIRLRGGTECVCPIRYLQHISEEA